MITEKSSKEIFETFSTEILSTLYGIAIFNEKYIFAGWVNDVLIQRGITKKEINQFTSQFTGFYQDLLSQEDL